MNLNRGESTTFGVLAALIALSPAASVSAAGLTGEVILDPMPTRFRPTVMAGSDPDSPTGRVDPNTTSSPFAGVVAVTTFGLLPGGSGVVIGPWHILTGRHVVDVPGADPHVVFNFGGDQTHVFTPTQIHFQPTTPSGFPYNDLAILILPDPVPTGVPVYSLYRTPVVAGSTQYTTVGYGGSANGDGVPDNNPNDRTITTKRFGRNVVDVIASDGVSAARLFIYDFDDPDGLGNNFLGGPSLGNTVETGTALGDSGSPIFVEVSPGVYEVAGINAFGLRFSTTGDPLTGPGPFGPVHPFFDSGGGGPLVQPYLDWIDSVLAIPEPDTWALLASVMIGMLGLSRGRRS